MPGDFDALTAIIREFGDALTPGIDPKLIDARPFFVGGGNVGFRDESSNGFALFRYLGRGGLYDAHLICRPKITRPIDIGRAGVALMFTHWRANAISALVPRANRASRVALRAIGGTPIGDSVDNLGRPCIAYVLRRGTWGRSSAASLELPVQ